MNFLELAYQAIENPSFILTAIVISFCVKIYLLKLLIPHGLRETTIYKPWFLLLSVLIGSMFGDIAWIIRLVREIYALSIPFSVTVFFVRISWGMLVLQYQALALFIESLPEKNFKLRIHQKIMVAISFSIALYFLGIALFDNNLTNQFDRSIAVSSALTANMPLEIRMMQFVAFYLLNLLILPSLIATFIKLRSNTLPKILKKQLKVFIVYLICPYILSESLQAAHFTLKIFQIHLYPIVSISTFLITYAIHYCFKRVTGLRFLNLENHVQSSHNFNFINDFKDLLEQLGHVTSFQELGQITQTFFKNAFGIPVRKTALYIRTTGHDEEASENLHRLESIIETFKATHTPDLTMLMQKVRILIYDEILFSNFYENSVERQTILSFLEALNADIFLPIFEKQKMIGYIIIERHSRESELFGDIERNEILVFASYLGNIINLLQNRNLEALIYQEKELREELYNKHQEINQYKESLRSFLRTKQKEIGIIFYKRNHFTYGNQAARSFITINLNTQAGHSLTKALRVLAMQVEEYKTPQTHITKDANGNTLVLSAVPSLEHNNVIIMVYYPEISDIVANKIDLLKDPTKWDYLLYLETTKAGQLIRQLIPSTGELFLNFQIDLLKLALSKKALLLEMPEEDLQQTVEIIHHISLRETLHVLTLQGPVKNYDTAIKLFGINPIFGATKTKKPLLESLDNNGTLFIKNIHFLDLESQEYLAEFIRYGIFRAFKSEQRIPSNVRIICSTDRNLHALVQESTFSQSLFNELRQASLNLPSLLMLPENEFKSLTDSFATQAIQTNEFKNLLELSEKEKNKLAYNRPISLCALKTKIQNLLIQKSKENYVYQETQFSPAYEVTDPELIEAAHLGKQALRDPKIMSLLWNKFKSQSKIATFLGVNRSSVNRRCKDYSLS